MVDHFHPYSQPSWSIQLVASAWTETSNIPPAQQGLILVSVTKDTYIISRFAVGQSSSFLLSSAILQGSSFGPYFPI